MLGACPRTQSRTRPRLGCPYTAQREPKAHISQVRTPRSCGDSTSIQLRAWVFTQQTSDFFWNLVQTFSISAPSNTSFLSGLRKLNFCPKREQSLHSDARSCLGGKSLSFSATCAGARWVGDAACSWGHGPSHFPENSSFFRIIDLSI